MIQNDVLILNGCCVRITDIRIQNVFTIRHTPGNCIQLSISRHVINIDDVKYTDVRTLANLLEATSRFAHLISADAITCNTEIPLSTLALIDFSGVIDTDYHHPRDLSQ